MSIVIGACVFKDSSLCAEGEGSTLVVFRVCIGDVVLNRDIEVSVSGGGGAVIENVSGFCDILQTGAHFIPDLILGSQVVCVTDDISGQGEADGVAFACFLGGAVGIGEVLVDSVGADLGREINGVVGVIPSAALVLGPYDNSVLYLSNVAAAGLLADARIVDARNIGFMRLSIAGSGLSGELGDRLDTEIIDIVESRKERGAVLACGVDCGLSRGIQTGRELILAGGFALEGCDLIEVKGEVGVFVTDCQGGIRRGSGGDHCDCQHYDKECREDNFD